MNVNHSADRNYNPFSDRFWLGQLDLRPLGFMRITFGAVLFWSVIDLAPVLIPFFSDQGVAPRTALFGLVRTNRISLFDLTGPRWLLITMFVMTLMSILTFMVGFRSRLASVTTFFLVCGLHERNLWALDGSDCVLRVMLFWLMFMPTGARYSVDAVLRAARGEPPVTHGLAMPIRLGQLQVAWVYFNTILFKWPGAEWHNGTALRVALGLDHLFTRWLGTVAFHQRWLVTTGTHFTVATELLFLPLAFLPLGRPRTGALSKLPSWLFQPMWKGLAIASGAAMHLGIAILMSVGNFSYIMLSTYFLLFEAEWIEAIVRFLEKRVGWSSRVDVFSRWVSPYVHPVPSVSERRKLHHDLLDTIPSWIRSGAPRLFYGAVLPGVMFLAMWFSVPDATKIPAIVVGRRQLTPKFEITPSKMWPPLYKAIEEMELWQRWNMFSPKPLDNDEYMMGRGELADGTQVDVLRGSRGNGGPILPPVMPGVIFTRWTKYASNLLADDTKDSPQLLQFGRYVCYEWNNDPPKGRPLLKTFKLYREASRVPLFDDKERDGWHEQMIWDHKCL